MKLILQILLIVALFGLIALQVYKGVSIRQAKLAVCPVDAITMVNGKAVIDSSKCIGCRRCVDGIANPLYASSKTNPPSTSVQPSQEKGVESFQPSQEKGVESFQPSQEKGVESFQPSKEIKPSLTSQAERTTHKPSSPNPKPAKPKPTHLVNADKCIGCQLCVSRCPVGAITMQNEVAVIDKAKCINCGICINGNNSDFNGCPVSAITKTE